MGVLEDRIKAFLDVGDGNGDGYGNGYGNGYGDGDGDGDGNGDGNGYGNGYGYGDGDGNGIKQFNGMDVYIIDNTPTIITNTKGQIASGYTIRYNTQLVPCFVARVGNYFGHGDTAHSALEAANAKYNKNRPLSDRIDEFVKEFPTLQNEATVKKFYDWHHVLTGSCEFGREEFRKRHNLTFDEVHTVGWFLDITKNNYGKDVIKQVRKMYYPFPV